MTDYNRLRNYDLMSCFTLFAIATCTFQQGTPIQNSIDDLMKATTLKYKNLESFYSLKFNIADSSRKQEVFIRKAGNEYRSLKVNEVFGLVWESEKPATTEQLLTIFQKRFNPTPAEVQKYAGIAPVTARSGNKCWVHWRLQCPKFLRQTFVEWAALSIPHCYWAKAFYEQQRARGSSHQAALRSLAFKWIRILHRCWICRSCYYSI